MHTITSNSACNTTLDGRWSFIGGRFGRKRSMAAGGCMRGGGMARVVLVVFIYSLHIHSVFLFSFFLFLYSS